MHKYFYNGPVMEFDKCIAEHWSGETMAVSASKAKTNLAYQLKNKYGKTARTKITLPGKIEIID